jgi:HEXXH motif-containing protein
LVDEALQYGGFASPHQPIDEALVHQIATTHFRRALRTFAARHGALIGERGSKDVVDLYERWFDTETTFEGVWHVSFGKMRELLAQKFGPATNGEVMLSAARVGLHLSEIGMTARFGVALEEPFRFRWGRFMLPECDRVDAVSEKERATLTLSLGGQRKVVELVMEQGEWATKDADPMPTFDTGSRTINILLPDTPEGKENMDHPRITTDGTPAAISRGYGGAFNVLREYAPMYVPFVNRLLRNLVPICAAPGGYVGGGSLRDNPGTVRLPFEREAVGLAANLGHECAHQHFLLVRGAGPVDDGSDNSGYTTVFVKGERDLPSVVLAYHAFANEALVLRAAEVGGISDPYAAERAELLRESLAPIEDIFVKSKALTPIGRALIFPVMDEMHRAFA